MRDLAREHRSNDARRRPAASFGLAVFGLIALGESEVHAADAESVPVLALDWSAPAECPDAAQVEARVVQLIGRSRGDRTLGARATISRSNGAPRYRLVLRVDTTGALSGERAMAGPDCSRLAEAAALVLALDIEQESRSEVRSEPPSDLAVRSAPEPREPMHVDSARARGELPRAGLERVPRATPIHVHVVPRLVLDRGSLPATTLGAGGLVELDRGPWSLTIAATTYGRQFVGGPRAGAAGADVDLSTLGLDGCWEARRDIHGLRMCIGIELGSEGTRGVGIERTDRNAAFWGAVDVGIQARPWRDRVIAPFAGVAVGHAFAAPDVVIEGFGTLFEAPVLFARLEFGLQVRLF